jgi:hypothetical protein
MRTHRRAEAVPSATDPVADRTAEHVGRVAGVEA